MLDTIANQVVGSGTDVLKAVRTEQRVEETAEKIASSFEFIVEHPSTDTAKRFLDFFLEKLLEAYDENILEYYFSDKLDDIEIFYQKFQFDGVLITSVKTHFAYETDAVNCLRENRAEVLSRLLDPRHLSQMKIS